MCSSAEGERTTKFFECVVFLGPRMFQEDLVTLVFQDSQISFTDDFRLSDAFLPVGCLFFEGYGSILLGWGGMRFLGPLSQKKEPV